MDNKEFIQGFFERVKSSLVDVSDELIQFKEMILEARDNNKKMLFGGNGASNIIGAHGALDIMNQTGIQTINVDNGSYITAASNDFGYENIFKRYVDLVIEEGDIVVLISSSGRSKNVLNAAEGAKRKGAKVVTFSGFDPKNPLRKLGDINFYVDNNEYNIVESIHNLWLVSVVDIIINENPDSVGIHGIEFDVKGIDNSKNG